MLKKLFIFATTLVAALLAYAAVKPSHYEVSREVSINASPAAIFPSINNSKKMDGWMT